MGLSALHTASPIPSEARASSQGLPPLSSHRACRFLDCLRDSRAPASCQFADMRIEVGAGYGQPAWLNFESSLKLMSAAGAEWVSAPTDAKSAPASA